MATEKNFELISWWTSLPIVEKERVSGKMYPACSIWWNELSPDAQEQTMTKSLEIRTQGNKPRW